MEIMEVKNKEELKSLVEENQAVYVLFYKESCQGTGSCSYHQVAEAWRGLADRYHEMGIVFISINCELEGTMKEFNSFCDIKACLSIRRFKKDLSPDKLHYPSNLEKTVMTIEGEIDALNDKKT